MNLIQNYIYNEIMEPWYQAANFFEIATQIASICEKMRLGIIPTAMISIFGAFAVITLKILIPIIIIKIIWNFLKNR